jgi:hypothetical protein
MNRRGTISTSNKRRAVEYISIKIPIYKIAKTDSRILMLIEKV